MLRCPAFALPKLPYNTYITCEKNPVCSPLICVVRPLHMTTLHPASWLKADVRPLLSLAWHFAWIQLFLALFLKVEICLENLLEFAEWRKSRRLQRIWHQFWWTVNISMEITNRHPTFITPYCCPLYYLHRHVLVCRHSSYILASI